VKVDQESKISDSKMSKKEKKNFPVSSKDKTGIWQDVFEEHSHPNKKTKRPNTQSKTLTPVASPVAKQLKTSKINILPPKSHLREAEMEQSGQDSSPSPCTLEDSCEVDGIDYDNREEVLKNICAQTHTSYRAPKLNESITEKLKRQRSMRFQIKRKLNELTFQPSSHDSIWQQLGLEPLMQTEKNLHTGPRSQHNQFSDDPKLQQLHFPSSAHCKYWKCLKETELESQCDLYSVQYEPPTNSENAKQQNLRRDRIMSRLRIKRVKLQNSLTSVCDMPKPIMQTQETLQEAHNGQSSQHLEHNDSMLQTLEAGGLAQW